MFNYIFYGREIFKMNNLFIEWIHAYGLAFFIFLIISSFINSNFLFEFLCTLYYSSSKSFIKNTKYVNEFVVIARFRCLACKKSNIILLFINHAFPTIFIISLLHMLQLLVWDTTIRFNGNKKKLYNNHKDCHYFLYISSLL